MHLKDQRMSAGIMLAALLMLLTGLIGHVHDAWAAPAGSVVTNNAVLEYSDGSGPVIQVSASDSFTVHEILSHALAWQDASPVAVQPGDIQRVISYELTNGGNGFDEYSLVLNTTVPGNTFAPTVLGIYLDSNSSGTYDIGDVQYLTSGVTPPIGEGGSLRIFVLANIPTSATDGDTAALELTAISNTVTPPVSVGDIISGGGDLGTDAVVGVANGTSLIQGSFVVTTYISMIKTAMVNSPSGTTQPMTGATIEYTILVSVTGSADVDSVVVSDIIPAGTTYVSESIYLDGAGKTDAPADDEAQFSAGTITVTIPGTMNSLSSPREIRFTVTID